MAWSWSHEYEAYLYAHRELLGLDRKILIEILAEWRMHDKHPGNDAAWADQWPKALALTERITAGRHEVALAEDIWKRAEKQATCDNGGWNAWMCPYGCHPHCVDFGPDDSDLHPRMTREEGLELLHRQGLCLDLA